MSVKHLYYFIELHVGLQEVCCVLLYPGILSSHLSVGRRPHSLEHLDSLLAHLALEVVYNHRISRRNWRLVSQTCIQVRLCETEKCVSCTCGMLSVRCAFADVLQVRERLVYTVQSYDYQHGSSPASHVVRSSGLHQDRKWISPVSLDPGLLSSHVCFSLVNHSLSMGCEE